MVGWLVQSLYKHELIKSKEPLDTTRVCISFRQHLSALELNLLQRMDDTVMSTAQAMLRRASLMMDEREEHREKTRKSLLVGLHQRNQGIESLCYVVIAFVFGSKTPTHFRFSSNIEDPLSEKRTRLDV